MHQFHLSTASQWQPPLVRSGTAFTTQLLSKAKNWCLLQKHEKHHISVTLVESRQNSPLELGQIHRLNNPYQWSLQIFCTTIASQFASKNIHVGVCCAMSFLHITYGLPQLNLNCQSVDTHFVSTEWKRIFNGTEPTNNHFQSYSFNSKPGKHLLIANKHRVLSKTLPQVCGVFWQHVVTEF